MNGRKGRPDTRQERAVALFVCPTCSEPPGAVCRGLNGQPLWSGHGPGCHPMRQKLLKTINRINIPAEGQE